MNESNVNLLNQIGDNADDTGIYSTARAASAGTDSDSDNELLPSTTELPEHDELDSLDHVPVDFLPAEVLTQSAEYRRKHFSNTSSDSSDSDDSITRGLEFKNIPVTATIEPQSSTSLFTDFPQAIARNLIQNIIQPIKSSQSRAFESDDEISDFEILDKDDLMK